MAEIPDPTQPFRDLAAALAATPDPVQRARELGAVLDAVPELQAQLRAARQEAVLELRQTRSNDDVAKLLGISAARVSQIAKGVSRTVKHSRATE